MSRTLDSRPTRRAAMAISAAILAVTGYAAGTVTAPSAQAFSQVSRTANAPWVEPMAAVIQSVNIGTPHSAQYSHQLVNNGPTVYRTTGSTGSQSVSVTYVAYKWSQASGSWFTYASQSKSTSIPANLQSRRLPAMSLNIGVSPGYYMVDYQVTWTSPIGAVLASSTIRTSTTADWLCAPLTCYNAYGPYVYLY